MAVIYVKEQGTYVQKKDNMLAITKSSRELATVPIANISDVAIFGNVQITTQALHMLMQEGIDISFFTYGGKMIGQVASGSSKNIFLRFAQYEAYEDINRRLIFAKQIVANKVENQIALIERYRWEEIDYDYRADIAQMRRNLELLDNQGTTNSIMGIEGICSSIYFASYGNMFRCKIEFHGRNRRPPKDPINIILSLAYTLLTKEVTAALEAESFETYLGFLHGIRYGRKSLALDIVEEFRQPIVDRLVLRLFNKQMLCEFDFYEDDERIQLSEDGFKKFCREYEAWMKKPVSELDKRSFRTIIQQQISKLKKSIREKENYIPYAWRKSYVSD